MDGGTACPRCGSTCLPRQVQCTDCGMKLRRPSGVPLALRTGKAGGRCPECREPYPPGSPFCSKCGCDLSGDADWDAPPDDPQPAEATAPPPDAPSWGFQDGAAPEGEIVAPPPGPGEDLGFRDGKDTPPETPQQEAAFEGPVTVAPVCARCGDPRQPDSNFCPKCAPVVARDESDSPPPSSGIVTSDEELQKLESISRILLLLLFRALPLAALAVGGVLAALYFSDKSGTLIWSVKPPGPNCFFDLEVTDHAVLVVRSDGKCAAHGPAAGAPLWETPLAGSLEGARFLTVSDGRAVLIADGKLACVDSHSGEVVWKGEAQSAYGPEPVVGSRAILLATDPPRPVLKDDEAAAPLSKKARMELLFNYSPPKLGLACVDLDSGKSRWTREELSPQILRLIAAGKQFFCLVSIPAKTEWRFCEKHQGKDGPEAVLYCHDCRRVEVEASRYELQAYRAQDGKRPWRILVKASEVVDTHLEGDRLVIATAQNLFCVSSEGKKLWQMELPSRPHQVSFLDGRALITMPEGEILFVSLANGKEVWGKKLDSDASEVALGHETAFAVVHVEKPRSEEGPTSIPFTNLPQDQMMKELLEEGQEEGAAGALSLGDVFGRTMPVLVALDLEEGQERWRRERVEGELIVRDEVVYAVSQSFAVSALDTHSHMMSSFAGLRALSVKKGKSLWKHSFKASQRAVKFGKDAIFVITEKAGGGTAQMMSGNQVYDSTVSAIRRRGVANRILKF